MNRAVCSNMLCRAAWQQTQALTYRTCFQTRHGLLEWNGCQVITTLCPQKTDWDVCSVLKRSHSFIFDDWYGFRSQRWSTPSPHILLNYVWNPDRSWSDLGSAASSMQRIETNVYVCKVTMTCHLVDSFSVCIQASLHCTASPIVIQTCNKYSIFSRGPVTVIFLIRHRILDTRTWGLNESNVSHWQQALRRVALTTRLGPWQCRTWTSEPWPSWRSWRSCCVRIVGHSVPLRTSWRFICRVVTVATEIWMTHRSPSFTVVHRDVFKVKIWMPSCHEAMPLGLRFTKTVLPGLWRNPSPNISGVASISFELRLNLANCPWVWHPNLTTTGCRMWETGVEDSELRGQGNHPCQWDAPSYGRDRCVDA